MFMPFSSIKESSRIDYLESKRYWRGVLRETLGHGLGQGVDHFLVSIDMIHVIR